MSIQMTMENLKKWYENWKDEKSVILFGFSHQLKNNIQILKEKYDIKLILDNNPAGLDETYQGIPIVKYSADMEELYRHKIIICTHYEEISAQLKCIGLMENINYCQIDKIISAYNWFDLSEVYVNEVHITVTTKCTLRCKCCNMLMPYYQEADHIDMKEIKEDIDRIFSFADKIGTLALLGGEPFLYPHLEHILEYIEENYIDKIGVLEIITNGTILPSEHLLSVIKKNKVFIRISDYTAEVNYRDKMKQFIECMNLNNIPYVQNADLQWLDFGFPNGNVKISENRLAKHMLECAPAFKGLNDGKLYFCHLVWSAEKCGLYKPNSQDSLDLRNMDSTLLEDKMKVLLYVLGIMEGKCISLCRICAGCGSYNTNYVKAAEQRG